MRDVFVLQKLELAITTIKSHFHSTKQAALAFYCILRAPLSFETTFAISIVMFCFGCAPIGGFFLNINKLTIMS